MYNLWHPPPKQKRRDSLVHFLIRCDIILDMLALHNVVQSLRQQEHFQTKWSSITVIRCCKTIKNTCKSWNVDYILQLPWVFLAVWSSLQYIDMFFCFTVTNLYGYPCGYDSVFLHCLNVKQCPPDVIWHWSHVPRPPTAFIWEVKDRTWIYRVKGGRTWKWG